MKDNTTDINLWKAPDEALSVKVFPNPSDAGMNIEVETKIRGNLSIRIFDASGKEVDTIQNGS
ncbi:MAG: T9SS type A sorting domain-containing protein [Bacteroidetes bacterium]|nr:T9SS type A sorting domain-containing protein [Bacteroidota bacterium]